MARTPEDEENDTDVDNKYYIIINATDDNSEADRELVESVDSITVLAWDVFRSLVRERMIIFAPTLLFIGLLDRFYYGLDLYS